MNVYICTDAQGHWPVGFAAVIVANNEAEARCLLAHALYAAGLANANPDNAFTVHLLDTAAPQATILINGDY